MDSTLHSMSNLCNDLRPLAYLNPNLSNVGARNIQLHSDCATLLPHHCRLSKFLSVKPENTRYDGHPFLGGIFNFLLHLIHPRVWNAQGVEKPPLYVNERRISVSFPTLPVERLGDDSTSPSPGRTDQHLTRDSQNS